MTRTINPDGLPGETTWPGSSTIWLVMSGGLEGADAAYQLIEVATAQPTVTVLVIPFTAGAHVAVEGSFAIIEFGVEPGAVLLEGKTADLYLEEDEIAAYQDTASRRQQSALDADDSVTLIEQVIREMT